MTNSRLRTLARPSFFLLTGLLSVAPVFAADPPAIPAETPAEAAHRHEVVATRRKGAVVICHRGASELAHENTLEAFRATFELGGDGNEFDIRTTKDGVLVVFHDDMLDRLLEAYGDVGDYTWQELQRFRFRDPGQFGEQCRIPTLVEVFDLHRKYGGLIHLDIKRPGQDKAIADLLTRMDLWDHVAFCNEDNAGVILQDPRLKLLRYKAPGLYADHTDVFPEAVAAALKKPGDGVIVDDPRAAIVALGRKLGQLSKEPVGTETAAVAQGRTNPRRGGPDRRPAKRRRLEPRSGNRCGQGGVGAAHPRPRPGGRAIAGVQNIVEGSVRGAGGASASAQLAQGLDVPRLRWRHGAAIPDPAGAPNAVDTARFALWRDDPALEPVVDPRWKNPRSWTDFRVKMVIFPALERLPGEATEKLCRDYLALSDEDARKIGPPLFEEAGKTLLAVSPRTETALELMKHRLQAVRGRAVARLPGPGEGAVGAGRPGERRTGGAGA